MADLIERLRENAELDAAEGGNPDVIAMELEAAQEIAALRSLARNYLEYTDNLEAKLVRALSQLRECAETLGVDQIDEMRASRAYADSMALLAEMPHLSSNECSDASLKERR